MTHSLSTEVRQITPALPAPRRVLPTAAPRIGDEWPQLWFATMLHSWTSLVIVPADRSALALPTARALAEAGRLFHDRPVHLVDAVGAGPGTAGDLVGMLADARMRGETAIVAVDCPLSNPAAILIGRAADAALLIVPLGTTGFRAARRTIEMIGRDRFLGSVTTLPAPRAAR